MEKHNWNKTQIKALKSSILHWERMRDNKRRKMNGELERPVGSNCACCKSSGTNSGGYYDCNKCAIKQYTGYSSCDNTPYGTASSAYFNESISSPQFKAAAKKQIIFMNKVLKAGIKEGR